MVTFQLLYKLGENFDVYSRSIFDSKNQRAQKIAGHTSTFILYVVNVVGWMME